MRFGNERIFKSNIWSNVTQCPQSHDHHKIIKWIFSYTDPRQLLSMVQHLSNPKCCLVYHYRHKLSKLYKYLKGRSRYGNIYKKNDKRQYQMMLMKKIKTQKHTRKQFYCCPQLETDHKRVYELKLSDKQNYNKIDSEFINHILSSINKDGRLIGRMLSITYIQQKKITNNLYGGYIDNCIKRLYCASLNYQEPNIYYKFTAQTKQGEQIKMQHRLNHRFANLYFKIKRTQNNNKNTSQKIIQQRILHIQQIILQKFQTIRRNMFPNSQSLSQFQDSYFILNQILYIRIYVVIMQQFKFNKQNKFFIHNKDQDTKIYQIIQKNDKICQKGENKQAKREKKDIQIAYKQATYSVDSGIYSYNWSYPNYKNNTNSEKYRFKDFLKTGAFYLISGTHNANLYTKQIFEMLKISIQNDVIFNLKQFRIGKIVFKQVANIYTQQYSIIILNDNINLMQKIKLKVNGQQINFGLFKIVNKINHDPIDAQQCNRIQNIILTFDNELYNKEITYRIYNVREDPKSLGIEIQFKNVDIAIKVIMKVQNLRRETTRKKMSLSLSDIQIL